VDTTAVTGLPFTALKMNRILKSRGVGLAKLVKKDDLVKITNI
jgi:hypothetical protein